MTVACYKKHWFLLSYDTCKVVFNVLNDGGTFSDINDTFIILIPNCKNAYVVKDFRPISLCNVLYKLVSKVFSNEIMFGSRFCDWGSLDCFHYGSSNIW